MMAPANSFTSCLNLLHQTALKMNTVFLGLVRAVLNCNITRGVSMKPAIKNLFSKLFLSSLVLVVSLQSLAEKNSFNQKKSEFISQSLEILGRSADSITLFGNLIQKDEKLKPILAEVADYLTAKLSELYSGETEYLGNIKNVAASCDEPSVELRFAAKCNLVIQYKTLAKTSIVFYVNTNKDLNPANVLENRAELVRSN